MTFATPLEREAFIEANRGLAVSYAVAVHRKGTFQHSSLGDIVQAATVGLIVAIDRHDPSRSELSTTAQIWMTKEVQRLYTASEPILSCPNRVNDNCSEATKRKHSLAMKSVGRPSIDRQAVRCRRFEALDMAFDWNEAVESLDSQQRRCLMVFLGLESGEMRALAKKLGVTRSRVYQIKEQALAVMRERLRSYGDAA